MESISMMMKCDSTISTIPVAKAEDLENVDARLRIGEKTLAVTQSRLDDVERTANHPEFTVGIKEMRKQLQSQITLIGLISALCLGLTISFITVMIAEVM